MIRSFRSDASKPIAQPGAGLDDDLGADAGRIAHRDRQMSLGHDVPSFKSAGSAGAASHHTSGGPKAPGLRYHLDARPGPALYHRFGKAGLQPPQTPAARCAPTAIMCAFSGLAAGGPEVPGRIDRPAQQRNLARKMLRRLRARKRARRFQSDEGDALVERPPDLVDIVSRHRRSVSRRHSHIANCTAVAAMIRAEHAEHRAPSSLRTPRHPFRARARRQARRCRTTTPCRNSPADLHDPIEVIVGFGVEHADPVAEARSDGSSSRASSPRLRNCSTNSSPTALQPPSAPRAHCWPSTRHAVPDAETPARQCRRPRARFAGMPPAPPTQGPRSRLSIFL